MAQGQGKYISLKPETVKAIKTECNNSVTDAKSTLKNLRGELEKICNETEYEPLINVLNELITKQINEEIPKIVDKILENWKTEAYEKHAKNMGIQSALTTAKNLDKDLYDLVKKLWQDKPLGEAIKAKTDAPEIDVARYDYLKQQIDKAAKALKENKDKHSKALKSDTATATTKSVAIPIIEAIFTPIENILVQFATKVDKYKQEADARNVSQLNLNTKTEADANTTGASAGDLTAMLELFTQGGK